METATKARLVSVAILLATFLLGASQDELLNFAAYLSAGGVASLFIWLQPKTDFGNWRKLTDHLTLSLPIAGLAAVTGAVVLYSPESGFKVAEWLSMVVGLLVSASVLEQRLMGDNP